MPKAFQPVKADRPGRYPSSGSKMAHCEASGVGVLSVVFSDRIKELFETADPEDRSMLNMGVFAGREDLIEHHDVIQKLSDWGQPKLMLSKLAFRNAYLTLDIEHGQRLSVRSTKAQQTKVQD